MYCIKFSDTVKMTNQSTLLSSSLPFSHTIVQDPVLPNADALFLSKQEALLLTFPCFSRADIAAGRLPDLYMDTIQDLIHPDDWRPFVFGTINFSEVRFHVDFMYKPPLTSHNRFVYKES